MKLLASWRARLARPAKPVSPPAPAPRPAVARQPLDVAEAYARFGPHVARGIVRAQRQRAGQRAKAEAPSEPPSWCPA